MAAGHFFPVFPCCHISRQIYAYNGKNDIFDPGQPIGEINDPFAKSNRETNAALSDSPNSDAGILIFGCSMGDQTRQGECLLIL